MPAAGHGRRVCSVATNGPRFAGRRERAGDHAGLRSDLEGPTRGGDRLRCRYGGPLHGFEEATARSGDGWGLRRSGTRRPLQSSAQSKVMSSRVESSVVVLDRGPASRRSRA